MAKGLNGRQVTKLWDKLDGIHGELEANSKRLEILELKFSIAWKAVTIIAGVISIAVSGAVVFFWG